MRNFATVCIFGAVLLGAVTMRADVTLGPGDTLDWDTDAPASGEEITATGGTLNFASSVTVTNVFNLHGEVTVNIAAGATVRFARSFRKMTAEGRMVLSSSAQFGSNNGGVYAFLPANSIAFAANAPADAVVTLRGYVSMTERPETWALPVVYANNVYLCFYGVNMTPSGTYTVLENSSLRLTSPTNLPAGTAVQVPSSSTLVCRPASFNPVTCAGSVIGSDTKTYGSNDVVLAGGELQIMSDSEFYYFGSVTGSGSIRKFDCFGKTYVRGTVAAMDGNSRLELVSHKNGKVTQTSNENLLRLASDFPGRVIFTTTEGAYYTNIISFGFNAYNPKKPTTSGSGSTNEVWTVGAIEGGNLIYDNGGAGARITYSAKQKIRADRLSGKIALFATSNAGEQNLDDFEIGEVADNTEIYVARGLRLTFGSVGTGVKVIFRTSQVNPSTITVTNGTLAEIRFLGDTVQAQPVTLNGGVDLISGKGKVIVSGGTSRVGYVDVGATLEVTGGTVTLDDGELFGSLPALWFDASDLSTYVPLYKEGHHAGYHEPSYLLGSDKPANVYTNDFPLVEKWYDKRPSQTLNFFWNDRWDHVSSAFYPQYYPYIIPNGLNGKPVLSFGSHNTSLTAEWGQYGDPTRSNTHTEQRRLHLMQGEGTGRAVYISTCVMVYGSEHGGGRCVFGGYDGNARTSTDGETNPPCADNYLRGAANYAVSAPIFATAYPTWLNGAEVDAANTALSGSFDVLSFSPSTAMAFRNIGSGRAVSAGTATAGGQDYAEFLVYTNSLTDAQRMTVEQWLANKWGLTAKMSAAGTVAISNGATVVGWRPNVSGEGTWALPMSTLVQMPTLSSTFAGVLSVPDENFAFTYANGTFTPALAFPDTDISFPATPTVTVTTGGALAAGDYALVSGKSLTGLTDCNLVHDIGGGMRVKLVRTATSLVLRVVPSGITVIFR